MIFEKLNSIIGEIERDKNLFKDEKLANNLLQFLRKSLQGKTTDLEFTYEELASLSEKSPFFLANAPPEIASKIKEACNDFLKDRLNIQKNAIDFIYQYHIFKDPEHLSQLEKNANLLEVYRKSFLAFAPLTYDEIIAVIKDNNLSILLSSLTHSGLFSQRSIDIYYSQLLKRLDTAIQITMTEKVPLSPKRHETYKLAKTQEEVKLSPETQRRIDAQQQKYSNVLSRDSPFKPLLPFRYSQYKRPINPNTVDQQKNMTEVVEKVNKLKINKP